MNCIIVDDEMASREVLNHLCTQTPSLKVDAIFENCIDALKHLNENPVDLIFLDLHMEHFSGFDLLKTLSGEQKVVLITSDESFALQSYEYRNVLDYLVKPVTRERFDMAVEKVRKQFVIDRFEAGESSQSQQSTESSSDSAKKSLFINIDRRLINLQFEDILYIEADGDYINVHTVSKNYRVHTTLKKIMARLPEVMFIQIHRSYIINFEKIVDVQDNTVLIDKKVIPISRSNRPTFMQRLNL